MKTKLEEIKEYARNGNDGMWSLTDINYLLAVIDGYEQVEEERLKRGRRL